MTLDIDTYQRLGLHTPPPTSVNDRSNADIVAALDHPADQVYRPCPEAEADSPEGTVSAWKNWSDSRVYPGTERDLWFYAPAELDRQRPVRLLICNDGAGYLSRRGDVRASRVLDTLHAQQELTNTVALFASPGRPEGWGPVTMTADYDPPTQQRSEEYDTLSPRFGELLKHELIPLLEDKLEVTVSSAPADRVICGISSGGIAAFSAAWFHPEHFGGVLSHCGSFTNIRGGHNYPYLVRTTPRKPVRVFLQSGAHDATTLFGDWPTANQAMAKALEYAGYESRFEFGIGGHTLRHGGSLFAEALRWFWALQPAAR